MHLETVLVVHLTSNLSSTHFLATTMDQTALSRLATPEMALENLIDGLSRREPRPFLDIPVECCNLVYQFLFAGARIVVTNGVSSPGACNIYDETDAGSYMTHVLYCNKTLLATCKSIKHEVLPVLSSQCTLAVYQHWNAPGSSPHTYRSTH